MLYLFVGLILSVVLLVGALKLLFWERPEKIAQKHQSDTPSVLLKKYPEADVEKFRLNFLQLGLLIAVSFSIMAFNYQMDVSEAIVPDAVYEIPAITYIPPTKQEPKPTLPPPEVVPIKKKSLSNLIKIVEDNIAIPEDIPDDEEFVDVLDDEISTLIIPEEKAPLDIPIIEDPEPVEDRIFEFVETMPSFEGGDMALLKFISKNVKYPAIARENGVEGVAVISFVIDEEGKVTDMEIIRNPGAGTGEEALRVVKMMPNWSPGKQRGNKVKVRYKLPIKFELG